MIKLTQKELNEKIRKHRKWLMAMGDGEKLVGAYDLTGCDLSFSDLRYSNLNNCNLSGCNLIFSDLRYSNINNCNLSDCNLYGSDLGDCNLHGSDLRGAKNVPYVPVACPTHGEFLAWKKVNNRIVKLKIPADAKRCSATKNKCRCDKAEVLAIENIDGSDSGLTEITNDTYAKCVYKVGEMVYPDSFDDDRWNECSHGIHFFIDRGEAERW